MTGYKAGYETPVQTAESKERGVEGIGSCGPEQNPFLGHPWNFYSHTYSSTVGRKDDDPLLLLH